MHTLTEQTLTQFEFSTIGSLLAAGSGIEQLMDDLGLALQEGGPDVRMLGGGGKKASVAHAEEILRAAGQGV